MCHLNPKIGATGKIPSLFNPVDDHDIPIPHCGIVMNMGDWVKFAERLKAKNIVFIVEPYIRFEGFSGEQATMFFLDPSGNALEFKGFKDINTQLFSTSTSIHD